MIKGISLFSNVGISEYYFNDAGIEIVGANELLKERCDFYKHIYPNVDVVEGDISNETVFNKMIEIYLKNNCEFLIATPPCQGMSVAGKMSQDDPRNKLIVYVINFIKKTLPKYILIENVPAFLKFSINVNGSPIKIVDFISNELSMLGYHLKFDVLDAADYNTPQYRKRAIVLISKNSNWNFPSKTKHITVRDVIGDLPSLESGQKSNIKYHNAKSHSINHVLWMSKTPTGQTALDNEINFPIKDGRKIKGFRTTYKRIEWDRPSPTITMCNGAISSQNNVHPGRLMPNGDYSDARVLSILELIRLTGLPDNWSIPDWASDNLIRNVIGESFPPKFAFSIVNMLEK